MLQARLSSVDLSIDNVETPTNLNEESKELGPQKRKSQVSEQTRL